MSSTAPSYIDDGRSFARRIPPADSSTNLSRWLKTTPLFPETASAYTGSYIDDGLDLLPGSTPGFGRVDAKFYEAPKRRGKGSGAWNDDIARAVGGDIHRSLARMKGVAGVQVKRSETSVRGEKEHRERRGVVSVPAPLKWGTFVIKGDDGRVVVIDDRGEYDSGAVKETVEKPEESRRWIKAARSPSPPAFVPPRHHSSHTVPHGWLSPSASPTSSVCSSTFTYLKAASLQQSRQRSLRDSRHTLSNQGSRHDDDQDTKLNHRSLDIIEVVYGETPLDEVSYSQVGWGGNAVSAHSWSDADKKGNSEGGGGAWEDVADGTIKSFGHGDTGSDLGWGGSAKGDGREGSRAGGKLGSVHGRSNDKSHSKHGDEEWDGFERPKTTSEVSVAGGSERSWPASQHSVHTHLTQRTQRSHTSRRSSRHSPPDWPASQAASKAGSDVHWGGSAVQSEQNWPTSAHGSEHSNHSWSKSKHGSEKGSLTKYHN
ncbi:uncharacterized protein M421DRAFT_5409 [Didymella exigua CBS 183.55]|uniref:Uncharacterized protein n=1 Tax=Didymella exigua CBS 183.55 TaxID=1150837 RepID=A0A6A5RML1_9PLEO|nr:uncharacterized protein M421DRAFT_5409 [Didymella exigua CBS 183.55]KAF1928358.1 hypothetical protein M421DRAFT_5409 [Didymella exigua CBS 183.55]